jgi:hypothetical protein
LKKAIFVLLLAALVGGVVLYTKRRAAKRGSGVRLAAARPAAEVKLECVHCRRTFALSEGKLVPGRQATVLCPHCRRTTPIGSEADAP